MTIFEYDEEQHKQTLLEEGYEDGFNAGFNDGYNNGKITSLTTQICRKLKKGKSPETIADELEEDLSIIQALCDVANHYAPDYDIQKIVKEYQQDTKPQTLSLNISE